MSELTERLTADLKKAMRAKNKVRLRTVRSLRAALRDKEIQERVGEEEELTEEQELQILQKQAKQRRESIQQYEGAGREDLAEQEKEELAVIEDYLPRQLTDQEIEEAVEGVIEETNSSSMADMGRVMGGAMGQLKGRADGNRVRKVAARLLSEREG